MISIITPVWNRSDLTAQYFLGHSLHYQNDPNIEWIIIDNGSTDGTMNTLQHWQPVFGARLTVLENEVNRGFSYGCNQGAAIAKGKILIFLNNDVIVRGDYITPLEKAILDNPNSIAGPSLLDFDTGWNVFDGKVISYLAGWCLAVNAVNFWLLGAFDEQFNPAYYEDVDLCYNALQSGLGLQRVALPMLAHLGEQTGRLLGDEKRKITETNRDKFSKKWGLTYGTK